MTNIVIAFIILAGAMYLAFRTVDAISARFNLFPKRYKSQGKTEQVIESVADGLSVAEYTTYNHQAIASCGMAAETVCNEAAYHAEGVAEGMQVLVESAGEHIAAAIEGLAHH